MAASAQPLSLIPESDIGSAWFYDRAQSAARPNFDSALDMLSFLGDPSQGATMVLSPSRNHCSHSVGYDISMLTNATDSGSLPSE